MNILMRKFFKIIDITYEKLKQKLVVHYFGFKKYDLILYDDIYPHPVSGFRLEEFTSLLTGIKNSKIILTPHSYPIVNTSLALHSKHIKDLINSNLKLKRRITLRKGLININTKLFYCIFLNNINYYINILEKFKIPFVFTLYPGGGFQMNNIESDAVLKRILSSPLFKKVIVTQSIVRDYLIDNRFCGIDDISFISGGVVPQISIIQGADKKNHYLFDKKTLDVCFCAGKYIPKGIDKGYDVFIEVAHLIIKKYEFVKFHVIGGFDENDIDITGIKDHIVFYGYKKFEELQPIFKNMDIIISPNKSFVLNGGSFDGFPLGTVIEAVLNGVLAIVSDDLNQNKTFKTDKDLIIIKSDCFEIEKKLIELIENPDRIIEIASNGRLKFQKEYTNDVQMKYRLDLLNEIINTSK